MMETLTQREFEIVEALYKGLQNHEIATSLGIAQSTVENQFNIIFLKMQVRNRTELIVRCITLGIIGPCRDYQCERLKRKPDAGGH